MKHLVFLGVGMIVMMIQWHAHYMKDSVSTIFDTIPMTVFSALFIVRYLTIKP